MFSKKMIYGFILSLFFINFSANAADLNEILKNGEVKIAVPEAFAPFGSGRSSTRYPCLFRTPAFVRLFLISQPIGGALQ